MFELRCPEKTLIRIGLFNGTRIPLSMELIGVRFIGRKAPANIKMIGRKEKA